MEAIYNRNYHSIKLNDRKGAKISSLLNDDYINIFYGDLLVFSLYYSLSASASVFLWLSSDAKIYYAPLDSSQKNLSFAEI